jgi:hypothetical protein
MFYSQALAETGAYVVVADIDSASVVQTSERLSKEHHGRTLGAELDVTSLVDITSLWLSDEGNIARCWLSPEAQRWSKTQLDTSL